VIISTPTLYIFTTVNRPPAAKKFPERQKLLNFRKFSGHFQLLAQISITNYRKVMNLKLTA